MVDEFCKYSGDKKRSKDVLKHFIVYFYSTIEDKINQSKQQSIKDKYIKIRKSALQYIVANERAITSNILKRISK